MSKKRTPAKKTSTRKAGKAKKKVGIWRVIRGIFLKILLLMIVVGGIGMIYLDAQIRQQFEGKRWALPAKVFARPLEMYPGLPLSLDDLKIELSGLGYQPVKKVSHPGQAEFGSSRVRLHTRGFRFPDGEEPSQELLIDFSGNSVSRIRDGAGNNVNLARLEPILVGGVYPQNNEDRDLIRLEDAPPFLAESLIAIEDKGYYDHFGISPRGIMRAMWVNIKAGRFVQGGSTLTQQLIKNFYLTSDRTLARKLMEIPMAVLLDFHYSKDEILQAYLNEVYLGQAGSRAIHGFGLGSEYYFSQPIKELQLHQVALLAGLVKGPSFYDPRRHPERALGRRNLVLSELRNQGKITEDEFQAAVAMPLGVVKEKSLLKGAYPAYLDFVKRQLRENYHEEDLSSEGLRVFSSLNPITQAKLEIGLTDTLAMLEKKYGKRVDKLETSAVVTDPQTGEVLAIVGGRSTRFQGFNRALDSVRPIGSLIKPSVYLTALRNGYSLVTPVEDEAINLKMPNGSVWSPQNFDKKTHGVIPMHKALANSYNLSTVKIGLDVGVDKVIDTLHKLGVTRHLDAFPSLLLGAQGLPPIEVAEYYQTIATNGFQMPLRGIRMVTDKDGVELSRYPYQVKQTIPGDEIHLLQYAMQEVAREGTARYVYSQLPSNTNVLGKTGTSNDQRDSWFAGFTGNRLAVVWVGRDDNEPLPFTGSGGALRAWTAYMKAERPEPFVAPAPEGVEYLWVDKATGYLSDERCEGAIQVPFIKGTRPEYRVDCGVEPLQNTPKNEPVDWFKRWFRQG
ncbi:penicillin-binding protein 1B [Neptunomonas phycophila]|jgi:penicillin-binding protein 1B|uniref:Penicillin-binding protein 1B n=2 Tax=Neptunomonas phycophila TaxID=1572645 RepID=A0AAW7XLC7_9GAMM|nr:MULTISPECIES: penicillin-binding protein 1B [Neptunomonas]MDN2659056.1 penicillin-binding protein 1B [Neptunomonas sp. CHC150]MDO6453645.1 penicillin-binding protein 1B [Neptunomonas phycophila]MDO6468202.1 penicillin-binding protein 1B [Neptunomonas phycophila]MDO6784650.1 penicillin-binding protein 1B [Neptunomonas phycophila]MDP2522211.1 penicillin-binding protein 1B [Neptunomonas phycophila]